MELVGKKVAVVGLGQSGMAAARLCLARGAEVTGFDEAPAHALSEAARDLASWGASLVCGPLGSDALVGFDCVVVSPGVPPREGLERAEAAGIEVIAELELASRFLTAPIALIGGTNGKSTVTALVGTMLEAEQRRVFVGGNFGTPLCEAVGAPHEVLVVEMSSFQAERLPTLRARVHALLNISEDHLDRYPDVDAYARAKGNPFEHMTDEDVAVVPADDTRCLAQASRGAARVVTFSGEGPADVTVEDGAVIERASGERISLASLKLRGRHNLANVAAAVAVARALGASPAALEHALASFAGLAHRNVLVAEIGGVRFYDDSKATNVGAAVAALRGLEEPRAVLIAGGRDKQGAYEPLVEALRLRGRALVVLGEAAGRIEEAASGVLPIARADSIEEAVRVAAQLAQPGDAVLLSPACSSYDMFTSYKARGEAFARAVHDELGGTA